MAVATFIRGGRTNCASLCGYGYIPLSFGEERRYENRTNNNNKMQGPRAFNRINMGCKFLFFLLFQDYHVIFVYKCKSRTEVYDLDSTQKFHSPFQDYVEKGIRSDGPIKPAYRR